MKYAPYAYKEYTVVLETLHLGNGKWRWVTTTTSQCCWKAWESSSNFGFNSEPEAFKAAKQAAEDAIDKTRP
jgi:hypothetical protein